MSATWAGQQQRFAAALLDPRRAAPDFLRSRAGASMEQRFDIYRNNVHASLIEALLAAFPVGARLVGEEFFRAMAREFLRQHLPQGAALHDYGAQLPGFIRGFAPAASLPYLADVAELEHAWWQAYGAADAPALTLAGLEGLQAAQLLAARVRMHPAMRLLQSPHPVHAIWALHQGSDEPAPVAHWEAQCVLLTRAEASVEVRCIGPAQHGFLHALAQGQSLEDAASMALGTDPAFDSGSTLLLAIEAGAIQELSA